MKAFFFIERDGRTLTSHLVISNAEVLFCTEAARDKLRAEMAKIGGFCSRCGLIARSDELADGKCRPQTGCDADVDGAIFDTQDFGQKLHAVFHEIWTAFARSLPRDPHDAVPEPDAGPDAPW